MRRLIYFIVFLLASCQQKESDSSNFTADYANLSEKGKIIMNVVMDNPACQEHWNVICKKGKPLPEEAISAYSGEYGSHYVIPIVSGENIEGVVFIPLEVTKEDNGKLQIYAKKIILIGKQSINSELQARMFIESDGFKSWKKKGLRLDTELVRINKFISESDFQKKRVTKSESNSEPKSSFTWNIYITTNEYVVVEKEVEDAITYAP